MSPKSTLRLASSAFSNSTCNADKRPGLTVALHGMGDPVAIFRLETARLIEAEGRRIKKCAPSVCGKLFVHRKSGLYCSAQCSQLERFQHYNARHSK